MFELTNTWAKILRYVAIGMACIYFVLAFASSMTNYYMEDYYSMGTFSWTIFFSVLLEGTFRTVLVLGLSEVIELVTLNRAKVHETQVRLREELSSLKSEETP